MAVIQISKLQARTGLQENLPQLATAEFGWSIDKRRLWVGNGDLSEGAPSTGNTEILTQYTDILNVIQSYVFKGVESGYTSLTSTDPATPIKRTVQNKIDEQISVRDFGVVGDGITDVTSRIQRAIDQIYPISQSGNPGVRRVLHFPAGTYLISSSLVVPPYASLQGDGIDSTIITHNGITPVIVFTDSKGQLGASMGDNDAKLPGYVDIVSMTLEHQNDYDVTYAESCNNIRFNQVKFKGAVTSPLSDSVSTTALLRLVGSSQDTFNIRISGCSFNDGTYGVVCVDNTYGVSITESIIDNVFQGIKTQFLTTAARSIRVTNSIFNLTYDSAIVSTNNSNVISAFNYFRNIGNVFGSYPLESSPVAPVLYFESVQNYSFGDMFDRTDFEATFSPRIRTTGAYSANLTALNSSGTLKYTPGSADVILPSTTWGNTSLSLSSVNATNAFIDYSMSRGTNSRTGTIKITINSTNSFMYEDSYVDMPSASDFSYGIDSPIGAELNFLPFGSNIVMTANTSSSTGNVNLKYNVRRFS